MRRSLAPLLAASLLSLALVLPAVVAASSPGDKAYGFGVRSASCEDCPEIEFQLNALSGPLGQNPTGTFYANIPDTAEFWADVTCLRVNGGTAVVAGVITSGTGEEADPGNPFLVVVKDGGKASKGYSKDSVSLVLWGVVDATAAELCADPTAFIGAAMFPLVSGELTVTDQTAPVLHDTAVGEGVRAPSCTDGCPEITFTLDAWSGPSGESSNGTFYANIPGTAEFWGYVTCLSVSGSGATVAGAITSGTGEEVEPGLPFILNVKDAGKSSKGVPKDNMSLVAWGDLGAVEFGTLCLDPFPILGSSWFPLVSGEITVKDVNP